MAFPPITTRSPALGTIASPRPSIDSHSNRPRFAYDWLASLRAAILAAAAITLYMLAVPRLLGIEEMDIGITVGRAIAPQGGVGAYLGRVAWHVGNGLCYVFIYAAVLLALRKQSSATTGAIFGIFLWSAGPMFLIPLLLNLFPPVASGELTNPGVLMLELNLGLLPAAVDLGAHLVHGIVTGTVYKHCVRS